MDEPPVNADDPADLATGFLSLPDVLQSAALMVIYAAQDLPDDEVISLPAVLNELAAMDMFTEEASHYLRMCGNVCTATHLTRLTG